MIDWNYHLLRSAGGNVRMPASGQSVSSAIGKEVIYMCMNTKKRNKELLHAEPADCDSCME